MEMKPRQVSVQPHPVYIDKNKLMKYSKLTINLQWSHQRIITFSLHFWQSSLYLGFTLRNPTEQIFSPWKHAEISIEKIYPSILVLHTQLPIFCFSLSIPFLILEFFERNGFPHHHFPYIHYSLLSCCSTLIFFLLLNILLVLFLFNCLYFKEFAQVFLIILFTLFFFQIFLNFLPT